MCGFRQQQRRAMQYRFSQQWMALVASPDGLAVDYLNDWIYWSSSAYRTIFMAKLDILYHRVVVNESMKLDMPRSLAVDPLRGY